VKYLPADVKVPERSGRVITLVDLATHRSGLPGFPRTCSRRAWQIRTSTTRSSSCEHDPEYRNVYRTRLTVGPPSAAA
jgi:CubicO group peptidase (beta-lactamase class C family)